MKKHQTDTASLVFAVIFLGVVVWWLVARFTTISVPGFGLMVAGTLITAGVVGLISALRPRKPEPAAASHTPGLFDGGGAYEQPVESGSTVSFQGMDLHGGLSDEERARADALLRKVDESRARTREAVTAEFPSAVADAETAEVPVVAEGGAPEGTVPETASAPEAARTVEQPAVEADGVDEAGTEAPTESVPAVKHDWPAEPGYFGPDGIADDRPTKRVEGPKTDDPSGGV